MARPVTRSSAICNNHVRPAMSLAVPRRFLHNTFSAKDTAPLAQLAEQLTLNQRVIGSSPIRGTPRYLTSAGNLAKNL